MPRSSRKNKKETLKGIKMNKNLLLIHTTFAISIFYQRVCTNLTIDIFPFQVLGLDEKNQILHSYLWQRQTWTDFKLKWSPTDYGGITEIRVPCSMVWLPDIVLYNNADPKFEKAMDTNVIIKHTGAIMWDQPFIAKSSCQLEVADFPFDEQECPFTFGSWTFHGQQLDIYTSSNMADLKDFIKNLEWDVIDMPVVREVTKFMCCPETYQIGSVKYCLFCFPCLGWKWPK